MNNTPTPWETGALMTQVQVLPPGWNAPMCIADCHAKHAPESEDERVANAAFITLAANNHHALVAALEHAEAVLRVTADYDRSNGQDTQDVEALTEIEAVLAKIRKHNR